MAEIRDLIARVDRPGYQVLIKALVYTANENRLRDIGSQVSLIVGNGGQTNLGGFTTLPRSSQNNNGSGSGNGSSFTSVISANGQVVVFKSRASNLSSTSDTNGATDLYAHDLQSGMTTLVSVNSQGNNSGNGETVPGDGDNPVVSDDGRFVAFDSEGGSLLAGPPQMSGGYLVQVSSQRNEADAQAAYRVLQHKFPAVLGSRAALVKRADLGDQGVFYRAAVGPFATPDEAFQFCTNLKSAGGQCVVQRN